MRPDDRDDLVGAVGDALTRDQPVPWSAAPGWPRAPSARRSRTCASSSGCWRAARSRARRDRCLLWRVEGRGLWAGHESPGPQA